MGRAEVTIRFLGAPQVEVAGQPVALHSRRSMALLAYVAINGGRHARASLAATFWEDAADGRARANLRSVLSTLQARVPGALEVSRDAVAFDPWSSVEVDVARFAASVAAADDEGASNEERIDACRAALDLHRGELLAGFEQLGITALTSWMEAERDLLRRRSVDAASLLVDLLLIEKRPAEAAAAATRLVALDPYREASYLASMRAALASGEPRGALAEFSRGQALIAGELGLALGPEITALAGAIRTEATAPASARPVLSRIDGLPMPRALFGRDRLIERVAAADRDATGGLITLCGPAGVGKTSLAVVVAHRWREQGHDVVYVDAASATRAPQLISTLANALGSGVSKGPDPLAGVIDLLADRSVRLVVDNLEQVDGAPPVIGELLARCPKLLLLATSRLPMRLSTERLHVVPSLELPAEQDVADGEPDEPSTHALKRLACVQLFQHRAVISGTGPASSARELRTVGRICRLLDGLPLAIELIATRRRVMGLTEIEASLRAGLVAGDLSLVEGGFRDVPQRHRGLRAALASTVDLLDPGARALFANASVFDGQFTLDNVVAVCADDAEDRDGVMQDVQALIDLHLVRREEKHGKVWFDMVAAVRILAASLLAESGGAEQVRARRIDHDCELIDRAGGALLSSENTGWFRDLDAYLPTLRSTLDELHERGDPRELAITTRLAPYWFDRGRVAEAHDRLTAASTATPDRERPWLSALNRLWCAGMRAEALGYGTASDTGASITAALADVRATAPPAIVMLEALRLAIHAHVADHTAPLDAASALVEEGIELASTSGQPWFRTAFVYARGVIHHLSGADEHAARQFRAAAADAQLHGNQRVWLYARMMLQIIDAEPSGATSASLAELLELAIELGDHRQTSWLTMSIATLAALDGDLGTAAAHYLDALTLSRDADYFIGIGCCLMGGAGLAVLRDDLADAMRFHACVEPDLESLGRSMPQAYLEAYRQLTDHLRDAASTDPDLDAEWARGALEPRSTALTALAAYLTTLRDQRPTPAAGTAPAGAT